MRAKLNPGAGNGSASGAPAVAAVVVHFGAPDLAARCLDSIDAAACVRARVVLVDNGPGRDRDLEGRVAARGGSYLNLPENPGFAGGANAGLERALAAGGVEMAVILNADVRLEPRCLALLLGALAADPSLGVVGPLLLCEHDPGRPWNAGGEIIWPQGKARARPRAAARSEGREGLRDVDFICGAVMAFRPALLDRVGDLPEEYYLYYEDADFCARVRRAGLRVALLEEASAWHRGGASFAGRKAEAVYYQVRNRLFFSRAWSPGPLRGRFSRLAFALETLGRAARHAARGRRPEAAACLEAVADYARGRAGRRRAEPARLDELPAATRPS